MFEKVKSERLELKCKIIDCFHLTIFISVSCKKLMRKKSKEDVCTDLAAFSLYLRPRSRFSHTDRLSSVNKMFIIWQKQEQLNSFNV